MADSLLDMVDHLSPCVDASNWLSMRTNPVKAWNECTRADWMTWLIARSRSPDHHRLARCLCDMVDLTAVCGPIELAGLFNAVKAHLAGRLAASDLRSKLDDCEKDRVMSSDIDDEITNLARLALGGDPTECNGIVVECLYAIRGSGVLNYLDWFQFAEIVRKHYPLPPSL